MTMWCKPAAGLSACSYTAHCAANRLSLRVADVELHSVGGLLDIGFGEAPDNGHHAPSSRLYGRPRSFGGLSWSVAGPRAVIPGDPLPLQSPSRSSRALNHRFAQPRPRAGSSSPEPIRTDEFALLVEHCTRGGSDRRRRSPFKPAIPGSMRFRRDVASRVPPRPIATQLLHLHVVVLAELEVESVAVVGRVFANACQATQCEQAPRRWARPLYVGTTRV
jgi:hypothetical protein